MPPLSAHEFCCQTRNNIRFFGLCRGGVAAQAGAHDCAMLKNTAPLLKTNPSRTAATQCIHRVRRRGRERNFHGGEISFTEAAPPRLKILRIRRRGE
jgi:hypothetical protein